MNWFRNHRLKFDHDIATESLPSRDPWRLLRGDDSMEISPWPACWGPLVCGMVLVEGSDWESAMRKHVFAAALMLPLLTSPGWAGLLDTLRFEGNSTGGIIAWTPEVDRIYHDIAAIHCSNYNKVPEITSVHRWYGDYVAFRCHFPRGYDPRKWQIYGPPARGFN